MKPTYIGVLPVYKAAGWTSHDVVAKARRLLGERRIGHTGTLDPAVTGVLPLCVGRATRLVEVLQELPKEYEAELTIGYATDTEDASGTTIAQAESVSITREQVEKALQQFNGTIKQIPPMYSAVKKDGKRLYELARQGIAVEREARQVTIHRIELLDYNDSGSFPIIRFRVACSKGTYIRTLCVDIGQSLGYPAVMSGLLRTETGGIRLSACYRLEEIEQMAEQGTLEQALIPIEDAVAFLPAVTVNASGSFQASNGIPVQWPGEAIVHPSNPPESEALVRVHQTNQELIGLFRYDPSLGVLLANKVFAPGNLNVSGG